MKKIWLGLVLLMAGMQGALAQPAQLALGTWADEDGESNIEIARCGASLCGRIIWLKHPNDETGKPKVDVNNPDTGQRLRPLFGLTILSGLQPDDDSRLKGKVYNAEDGNVYEVYLTPQSTTMEVEGCFALILCGSQTWTRVK